MIASFNLRGHVPENSDFGFNFYSWILLTCTNLLAKLMISNKYFQLINPKNK